jgi:predicted N-formylglutamate amidohydrolase
MRNFLIFTCEHAGNIVPAGYEDIFSQHEEILQTHRGWDPGALEMAQYLSNAFKAPLYYTDVTRLLVEANRTKGEPGHFSEFTESLPYERKREIIKEFYTPYRKKVCNAITAKAKAGYRVIHLSIHTFTEMLHGEKRDADIGLLYDPARKTETAFCKKLASALLKEDPDWNVKFNYPYSGTSDGFTTFLRTRFVDEQYAGIELEHCQKYPEADHKDKWHQMQQDMADAIRRVLDEMQDNF